MLGEQIPFGSSQGGCKTEMKKQGVGPMWTTRGVDLMTLDDLAHLGFPDLCDCIPESATLVEGGLGLHICACGCFPTGDELRRCQDCAASSVPWGVLWCSPLPAPPSPVSRGLLRAELVSGNPAGGSLCSSGSAGSAALPWHLTAAGC